MKKRKNGLLVIALLIAVVVLGIGYAIGSDLNITGNATATPDQSNFNVVFDRATEGHTTPIVDTTNSTISTPATSITATYTDDYNATFNAAKFKAIGEKAIVKYHVKNTGSIDASVAVTAQMVDGSNAAGSASYFNIVASPASFNLAAGATQEVTLTVTLAKAASTTDVTADVDVKLAATVQGAGN